MQNPSVWEILLLWLENNSLSLMIRQSVWLYPLVEIVHIVGFAILVGAAVMYDLRLLGLSRQLPVKAVTGHLSVWARLSLIAVIPSGLMLFMVDATSMASNPAFRIKIVLIFAAGINALVFHLYTLKTADLWNQYSAPPAAARLAGIISIVLWVSVIACGRLIAYV